MLVLGKKIDLEKKMKACGIIVEYNPFHNGHKYHLEKAKTLSKADLVIAVMSGNFLQRGEPAILNKWLRAKMALLSGVDLVIELPSIYSTDVGEFFAKGAIKILNELKVDSLVFGSEMGDVDVLKKIVSFTEETEFSNKIKELLKEGMSYPNAMRLLVEEKFGKDSLNPNNILGIEYLRAIKSTKSFIKPMTIKREKVGYYEEGFVDKIASATGIRKMINEREIENLAQLMPEESYKILTENLDNIADFSHYFLLLKFKALNDKKSLEKTLDMEEGLWNRVYQCLKDSNTLEEFMESFVNKRYTLSRTKRILIHMLLDINISDRDKPLSYIRALAFNESGAKYIKYLKKEFDIKIMSSNKNINEFCSNVEFFQKELDRDEIYKLIHPYEDEKFAIKIK